MKKIVKKGNQLHLLADKDIIKIEPVEKNSLSHIVGRVIITEPVDLEHMRQVTQKQIAQTIHREELG